MPFKQTLKRLEAATVQDLREFARAEFVVCCRQNDHDCQAAADPPETAKCESSIGGGRRWARDSGAVSFFIAAVVGVGNVASLAGALFLRVHKMCIFCHSTRCLLLRFLVRSHLHAPASLHTVWCVHAENGAKRKEASPGDRLVSF